MIKTECASKERIEVITQSTNAKDKILVEKVVRALMLLEGLAKSDLDFVFKGGTALKVSKHMKSLKNKRLRVSC